MVGKGVEPKSSRIFQQCYAKCCKLQNLTPLNNVLPTGNGKILDFCVDRIKYADWPPILNALSCDLSLHSISIRCRQPVKTVLEQIDCDRLAKTVNKRAVILTNFMLNNLVEAISQLLSNTTLLTSLLLEGLPLKIPYLNPLCEAVLLNSSLQHLYFQRCLLGDAGCLAICKAVRCLPNVLTLDLSGCELTMLGASYIAELVKHKYAGWRAVTPSTACSATSAVCRYVTIGPVPENKEDQFIPKDPSIQRELDPYITLSSPDLDTMAGLRRITLCGNTQLGDAGLTKLLEVLADDLWIKALDVQNCGLTEATATATLNMMRSNTTLVVLDLRHNSEISIESLSKVRSALRANERGTAGQYSWLGNVSGCSSDGRIKTVVKNGAVKDRGTITKNAPSKYVAKSSVVKKEKDYTEVLEEQLQEEISHRQQLEELNLQLVDQMKQLKQQQIKLWANGAMSSGSEQSFQASSRSGDYSSSSGSSSSIPIDQNTLSYIQQAFKDIYEFIKNNQCHGQCLVDTANDKNVEETIVNEATEAEMHGYSELRANIVAKKAQSTHVKMLTNAKMTKKMTKSAHLLGDVPGSQRSRDVEMKPEMIEKQMGDTRASNEERCYDDMRTKTKKSSSQDRSSPSSSMVSDSSDTLVCSPQLTQRTLAINPREAFYSSDDDESS